MFVTLHSNSRRMKVEETLFSILRSEMWQTPLELCLSEDELNDVPDRTYLYCGTGCEDRDIFVNAPYEGTSWKGVKI